MSASDSQTPNPGFKGPAISIAAVVAALALVVTGIEISRRSKITTNRPADTPAARPFPRELRDALGESLVIQREPRRIASQTLGTDEILLAICPPERIVALSELAEDRDYSNVAEQARQIPGRPTQGVEQILELQPDLVFVASYGRAEMIELLKASRAPVFRFANFNSIADVKSNIRTVGSAIGADAAAEAVIRQMDQDLAVIRSRIPRGASPVRVMSYDRLGYTAGSQTIFDDVVHTAGAVNVSAEQGISGFAKINSEKVLEWQPDFLITGANRGEKKSVQERLLADPAIAASQAGRAGRIIVIDYRHLLTASHHVVRAVEDLTTGLYGDRK